MMTSFGIVVVAAEPFGGDDKSASAMTSRLSIKLTKKDKQTWEVMAKQKYKTNKWKVQTNQPKPSWSHCTALCHSLLVDFHPVRQDSKPVSLDGEVPVD
jgi:hypothetical protein